ncbi:porin [Spirosoma luteum]|uniref:porin n=1 Tax=Spirosoma luteum TaxID=431553 RepID=UPI0003650F5A|nr:porin [Spirosoma luteum]
MNKLLFFSAACLCAASSVAVAQSADSTGSTAPAPTAPALTLTGYVEAFYTFDLTAPKTAQERPSFLYNHKRNREFNINHAYLKLAYVTDRVRGNLALQVGTYAQYNYAAEQPLLKNVYEASVGVKLSRTHDLWLNAGVFGSHIGFESAVSKDCWTLTRSILAENSPYYLTGVKLTYTNGKWTLLGSVLNGWQRIAKVSGYSGPSVSTQVQFRPSDKVTLNWSTFLGSDRPDSLKQGRFFNNFYTIINPAGRFGVILGFDIGSDRKPVVRTGSVDRVEGGAAYIWYSPVVIARYKTSDRSYLNGRVEYYDDKKAVITDILGFQSMGYSLGYDYYILPQALFRIEGKIYDSKTPIFETTSGFCRQNTSLTTSLAVSF